MPRLLEEKGEFNLGQIKSQVDSEPLRAKISRENADLGLKREDRAGIMDWGILFIDDRLCCEMSLTSPKGQLKSKNTRGPVPGGQLGINMALQKGSQ